MTIEEYQSAVQASVLCSRMLSQYDIPQLLRDIEHADAVGGLFNPSLWIQKRIAMYEDREALEAALPLWRLAKKLEQGRAASQTQKSSP